MSSKFFFEKVNGKQFHPTYSECDIFSARVQIRKYKYSSWNYVIKLLKELNWNNIIKDSLKNKTHLTASFRIRIPGDHDICEKKSRFYKDAIKKLSPDNPEVFFQRPKKCLIRRKK